MEREFGGKKKSAALWQFMNEMVIHNTYLEGGSFLTGSELLSN